MSESRMKWVTSVPILVFLGLSVLEFDPMYATDRQTSDVRQKHRLMPPPYGDGSIIKSNKICIFIAMFSRWRHCGASAERLNTAKYYCQVGLYGANNAIIASTFVAGKKPSGQKARQEFVNSPPQPFSLHHHSQNANTVDSQLSHFCV